VDSLARPGGNVTGFSFYNLDISRKRLELLSELVAGLKRIAVLRNPMLVIHSSFWNETVEAARQLGIAVEAFEVRGPEDLDKAFDGAHRANAQAIIAFDDPLTLAHRRSIAALAASIGLPAIYGFREFPEDGGLMSYGVSLAYLYRSAATLVDKILKGAKPAELPVEQPTKLELVINLKTATALGLTIPPTLLARADEVIE
jgi:putative ABC transport system substrate-binding protein